MRLLLSYAERLVPAHLQTAQHMTVYYMYQALLHQSGSRPVSAFPEPPDLSKQASAHAVAMPGNPLQSIPDSHVAVDRHDASKLEKTLPPVGVSSLYRAAQTKHHRLAPRYRDMPAVALQLGINCRSCSWHLQRSGCTSEHECMPCCTGLCWGHLLTLHTHALPQSSGLQRVLTSAGR